jgi:integrase
MKPHSKLAKILTRAATRRNEAGSPKKPPAPLLSTFARLYATEHEIARGTVGVMRAAIRAFERWKGRPATLADLAKEINEFLIDLSRGNRQTANCYRRILVTLLNKGDRMGVVERPKVVRHVRLADLVPRAFTDDELRRLCEATVHHRYGPYLLAAIRLTFDTALRRGDIFRVRWSEVNDRRLLTTTARKTGRRVTRQIRPSTIVALAAIRDPSDNRLIPWPFAHWTTWRISFRELCRAAKIAVRRPGLQMIRRSAASYLKRDGKDPAQILGHSAKSGDLAGAYYIDPSIAETTAPLAPDFSKQAEPSRAKVKAAMKPPMPPPPREEMQRKPAVLLLALLNTFAAECLAGHCLETRLGYRRAVDWFSRSLCRAATTADLQLVNFPPFFEFCQRQGVRQREIENHRGRLSKLWWFATERGVSPPWLIIPRVPKPSSTK